jgi:Ca2+-binding EF-hand superfamily protein
MAAAAFFNQKVKTLFNRFDADHNGKIELEDFENWGAKLAQIGKLNKEKSVTLTNNLLQIWENLFLPADTNRDGSVELPELQVRILKLFKLFRFELFQFVLFLFRAI